MRNFKVPRNIPKCQTCGKSFKDCCCNGSLKQKDMIIENPHLKKLIEKISQDKLYEAINHYIQENHDKPMLKLIEDKERDIIAFGAWLTRSNSPYDIKRLYREFKSDSK